MFENRIIAFIDILGTKALLHDDKRKEILPKLIGDFAKLITEGGIEEKNVSKSLFLFDPTWRSVIEDIGTDTENQRKIRSHKFDIAAFSDHIVISFPYNPEDNLILKKLGHLKMLIADLCIKAFECGIVLRGAITKGELYHKGGVVSGRALVEAYEMEEKCAIYPRVILSDSIAALIKNNAANGFRRAEDGFYSIDWLYWVVLLHHPELVEVTDDEGNTIYESDGFTPKFEPTDKIISEINPDGALMVKQAVESQINSAIENGIIGKWRWLASYYNQIITEFDFSKDHMDLLIEIT